MQTRTLADAQSPQFSPGHELNPRRHSERNEVSRQRLSAWLICATVLLTQGCGQKGPLKPTSSAAIAPEVAHTIDTRRH
jgi:predicted small lipoprotein YifL